MSESDEVRACIEAVDGVTRRRDAETLLALYRRVTGEPPKLWPPSIIGFGQYHYRYASGREGDAGAAGFSPRKAATTIYLPDGAGAYAGLLERLGDHKATVGCLYITNLDKVDMAVLDAIIDESWHTMNSGTYLHRAAESRGGRPEPHQG